MWFPSEPSGGTGSKQEVLCVYCGLEKPGKVSDRLLFGIPDGMAICAKGDLRVGVTEARGGRADVDAARDHLSRSSYLYSF